MPCKRCGQEGHASANSLACTKNRISRKVRSWRGDELSECELTDEVLAGLLDADGTVGVYNHGQQQVALYQSYQFGLDLLDIVQLYTNSGKVYGPTRRAEYQLRWHGADAQGVKDLMDKHCVLKCSGGMKLGRINDGWIGGMFAGDGGVSWANGTWEVAITQSSRSEVLHAIRDYLGYGTVYGEKRWGCTGPNARTFATRFSKYSLHKKPDLDALSL